MTRGRAFQIAAVAFVVGAGLLISGRGPIPPGALWGAIGASACGMLLARYGT